MLSAVYAMKRIREQLENRFRCSIWSDNAALVLRMKKMLDHNPIAANLRNDLDLYC